ncbi:hypothetical protein [Deinococcus aquaticus]|uniref:SH3 domain-containing protein n=1 Tax=Deinococcus aquaticus TaxID=328692 RepID=A0ABY7UXQ8_9DEIO|nr:hypothetical protein [Deinococcus aquaticus]WDA57640.1 hypothetical protein M8445_09725 [Deinococcus aquaticus]
MNFPPGRGTGRRTLLAALLAVTAGHLTVRALGTTPPTAPAALPATLNLAAKPAPVAGWVTVSVSQFLKPDPRSATLRILPAHTPVTVHRCFERWCEVGVPGDTRTGWVMRSSVDLRGDCAALVPLGLKDLRRTEGAYNAARDSNSNGRACDREDLIATRP